MAERIHSFSPQRGRPRTYPWDVWTDGSAWRLREGEDFEVSSASMVSTLHKHAERAGLVVTTVRTDDGVEFQFSERREAA